MLEEEIRALIVQFFSSVWGNAVAWFGGLYALLLSIRTLFNHIDEEVDPERRQSLGVYLAHSKNWGSGSWVPDFTLVFDRFFGKKHLRWRCFYRSGLISIISFLVLLWLSPLGGFFMEGELCQRRAKTAR